MEANSVLLTHPPEQLESDHFKHQNQLSPNPSSQTTKICLLTTTFASTTFISSYTSLTFGRICNIQLSGSSRTMRLTSDINQRTILIPVPILSHEIIPIINLLLLEHNVQMEKIMVLAIVAKTSVIEEVLKKFRVRIVAGRIGDDEIGEFPGRYFGYE